jgi:hypothetical protein
MPRTLRAKNRLGERVAVKSQGKVKEEAAMVRIIEHGRKYYECREVPCGNERRW